MLNASIYKHIENMNRIYSTLNIVSNVMKYNINLIFKNADRIEMILFQK